MKRVQWSSWVLLVLLVSLGGCRPESRELERLSPGSVVSGFELENLYEDGAGRVMGGRLLSQRHGFLLDLLRIQSVPQGFFWIKTVPWSDRGEPHACEHLLLGKGRQGRRVAALEEMTLGRSSAWTAQLNTVYHFNALAGEQAFYQTLEARLRALLHPDFDDEEIRREVSHMGVSEDPASGQLSLEEKGTVYTEMVSSFEGPGYPLWRDMGELLYGKDHPAANVSGGDPDSMRSMTPADLWRFHDEFYRAANMGLIVALPQDMPLTDFLSRLDAILQRLDPDGDGDAHPDMGGYDLPAPETTADVKTVRIEPYPSENSEDPAQILVAWPPEAPLDPFDSFLRHIFLRSLADGPGTPLYDAFINSTKRRIDLSAGSVFAYQSDDPGEPVYIGFDGVDRRDIESERLQALRTLLLDEIRSIGALPDGSDALRDFNAIVASRLAAERKSLEQALNQPPMFGYRRGTAGHWQDLLAFLEREDGFRKSLVLAPYFSAADSILALPDNPWRERISAWRFLAKAPLLLAVVPSPELMDATRQRKDERLAAFSAGLRQRYACTDEQTALARFKADFDAETAHLDSLAAGDPMPRFIDDPPLSLDEQLDYGIIPLDGPELFAATFDNLSTATLGIALRLDVLPAEHLMTLPLFTAALTDIGVTLAGERVDAEEMGRRLRSELTAYDAYIDSNPETGRVELVLRGTANGEEEMRALLGWMQASLWGSYLEKENLPRLRDVVDQSLKRLRSRMQGSEESWVADPARAYRYQSDPLYLSTASFLTRIHLLQRLQWLLAEPASAQDAQELERFIAGLAAEARGRDRGALGALLDAPPALPSSDPGRQQATAIVATLRQCLPDIPDDALAGDWARLCREIGEDLATPPEVTLASLRAGLGLLLKRDNARLFMISSRRAREAALPGITALCARLDDSSSRRQTYSREPRITERLMERRALSERPVYVGLLDENTRNGTLLFSARNAGAWDCDPDKVLDALAGKVYGGGGGHGLFMRTWAAGLAYSNGYGYRDGTGMANYYAERCPDVAKTMDFVVSVLKDASVDDALVEYAVAVAFGASRAAGPYDGRGESMAADLADGIDPKRVRAYRRELLSLRKRGDLADELRARIPAVCGEVMIGLGPNLAETRDGVFFLIGPESQFESLEQYIAAAETPRRIERLYPRDYWLPD